MLVNLSIAGAGATLTRFGLHTREVHDCALAIVCRAFWGQRLIKDSLSLAGSMTYAATLANLYLDSLKSFKAGRGVKVATII